MIRLNARGQIVTNVRHILSFVTVSSLLFGIVYLATSPVNAYTSQEFVTVWKTDNPGTSNSTSITIPTSGSGSTIVWPGHIQSVFVGSFHKFISTMQAINKRFWRSSSGVTLPGVRCSMLFMAPATLT